MRGFGSRKTGELEPIRPVDHDPWENRPTASDYRVQHRMWSAPPDEPLRYSRGARLQDTYHGWRDGRLGIPHLDVEQFAADPDALVESGFGEMPVEQVAPIETPWTLGLYRRGDLQISEEWIVHQRESALLTSWFAAAITRAAALSRTLEQAAQRLEDAAKPPDPSALTVRRPAEQGPDGRSDALVRARRLADHDRRLKATQAAYLAAHEQFGRASVEVIVLGDLLQRRTTVTRIRVHRIEDHTWQRVSTYWRKLIRVHRSGAVLNSRLAPLAPALPRWARDGADRDQLV
jgi:hypothetical protein